MSVLVVYESMFGNTREVAEAIAGGFGSAGDATIVRVADAPKSIPAGSLVIVGAPTHVHGLPSRRSRDEAVTWSNDPDRGLRLEPGVVTRGVREWLADLVSPIENFAAFDTRVDIARVLSGSAAVEIDKALGRLGGHRVDDPTSFLEHDNHLLVGELEKARAWGQRLAGLILG
jgi:hypothetical protein